MYQILLKLTFRKDMERQFIQRKRSSDFTYWLKKKVYEVFTVVSPKYV